LEQEVNQSIGDKTIQHGIAAYAHKQAYYCKSLAESLVITWLLFLELEGIAPEWKMRYERLIANRKSRSTAMPVQHSPDEQDETNGKETDEVDVEKKEEMQYR
jgi:hypothetical protein